MTRLTDIEASRLQEALAQLYAVVPLAAFPDRALAAARQLVACIHCSYNEIDTARGRHRIVADPPELLRHPAAAHFPRYVHQHPVIGHYAATRDPRSHLINDFLTATEFRRLELYYEFFRPLDTESQLSVTLSSDRGRCVIGLAFNRGREGFNERDRLLLDLLRPHLLIAHNNASKLTAAFVGADPSEGSDGAATLDRLTGRQRQILRLLAAGRTNAQIAFELDISPATAKKHVEHILDRLDVTTRTAAAARYVAATAIHGDDPRGG